MGAVFVIGIGAAITVLIAMTSSGPARAYLLGALHVGLVATFLHVLNAAFLAHDQEAIRHLRGSWGEDNTRSELQRGKRRRLLWGWVDSIELQAGDIDHLVVTREGGLVMIDSKWRNQVDTANVQAMAASAQRARRRAEGVARSLLSAERTHRHRARLQSVNVTPAVVVWGAARTGVPDDTVVDGVHFIDGRRLLTWIATLDGHSVPRDAARDILARLGEFRATSGRQPAPSD
ncbi:hypothetical protein GCM10022237_08340 [Nocardioides ginsengisoli]|uniref:NERD domain-containing protein n=1 Tax=Nocardioides ginsengisoli TaxID=363868 RepID=A0ABW3W0Q8_9ACTN